MECKICKKKSYYLFTKKVLGKYDAKYFQCGDCDFIQVENPSWLKEAYEEAISSSDTGLVSRNLFFSSITEKLITEYFNYNKKFVDYGGGYGLFVRLMRDKGFDFYRQDAYCQNLFAQYFDICDLKEADRKFELLTTFELFEHLEYPLTEIENMLQFSDSILFSTELQPNNIKNHENWWYFGVENGQHISFYTKKSLESIAKNFNLFLYTNNASLHLLTKKELKDSPFKSKSDGLFFRIIKKILSSFHKTGLHDIESRTQKDSDFIKTKLRI